MLVMWVLLKTSQHILKTSMRRETTHLLEPLTKSAIY